MAEDVNAHRLVDGTLTNERGGIAARCVCGWSSLYHFTSLAASAAFRDHVEEAEAGTDGKFSDFRGGDEA